MAKKRSQSKAAMARAVARGRQQAEAQAGAQPGADAADDLSQDEVSGSGDDADASELTVGQGDADAVSAAADDNAGDSADAGNSEAPEAATAKLSEEPAVQAVNTDDGSDAEPEPVHAGAGASLEPDQPHVEAAQTSDDAQAPAASADDARVPQGSPAPAVLHAQDESAFAAAQPEEGSIRGVLIQVAGGRLLLPNATIAEVLSYAQPEAMENAPEWLLGRMRWRGWQLPMIAFSQMAGIGAERAGLGTKVVVLKALGRNGRVPYFAMVTQGFPRLVTVTQDSLLLDAGDASELPRGIQARVRLNQDDALLPDLETVETLIGEALSQAA